MTVATEDAPRLCADCGRDLSAVPSGTPCLCGGTRRVRPDPAVYRRPAGAEPVRYDPFKNWAVKYLQFTWNVSQLRRIYTSESTAVTAELRPIVEMTFASCSQLADWLSSGPEPVTVSPGDLARLMAAEPLSICAALGGGGTSTARLVPAAFSRWSRCWVEYQGGEAKPTRYDALDLAERCLSAWRAFLTDRGVALPSW